MEVPADITALASPLGLEIPIEYRANVAIQWAALLTQAALLMSEPLEDELEPAPVFTP